MSVSVNDPTAPKRAPISADWLVLYVGVGALALSSLMVIFSPPSAQSQGNAGQVASAFSDASEN